TVPWTAGAEACSAHAGSDEPDPGRHLWLRENGRLTLYVTDTGDFTSTEIARVKSELSHLFLDCAAPGVLDDFKHGMRRVLPDQESLARLRAALPEARLHAGDIEHFDGEPASYDHVLCLRALNHVTDVDEALSRMATLLKPAGSLFLVEMTPFAMLREAAQVAAADRAPRAGHQHFRNMASDDVVPFVGRHGLRVVEHHRASRETTNQW